MYALTLALLTTTAAQPPAPHEDQNTLFKSLLDSGLVINDKVKIKFPKPSMPDGLNAAKQKEVIKSIINGDYDYDEFTRKSVVAPQLMKIRDIPGGAANAPIRGVDVWFVIYGDYKKLEDDKFLDKLVNTSRGTNGKGGELKADELAKRGIKKGDAKHEGYGFVEFDFLEKVRLKATGHAMWSRTNESVVAAAEIDPRFLNDKEYPNQWRSITKANGQVQLGNPEPWSGAAMYFKITKLHEPAGAMFVEQHVIFVEPTGWFGGANLLGSKLPIAVQDNVRTMRKEFLK